MDLEPRMSFGWTIKWNYDCQLEGPKIITAQSGPDSGIVCPTQGIEPWPFCSSIWSAPYFPSDLSVEGPGGLSALRNGRNEMSDR